MITYDVEDFCSIANELKELIKFHWLEIAENKDKIPLAPNWEVYAKLNNAELLHTITARDENKLIGYAIFTVQPHLHYNTSLTAQDDVFYILPEYRNNNAGINIFIFAEEFLRSLGVERIYLHCKVKHDLTKLFEKLDYTKVEYKFSKYIGD